MAATRWTGKGRAVVIAVLTLACLAFLSAAAPTPVSIAELGSTWQCTRVVFVLTTCTFTGVVQNLHDKVASRRDR